MKSVSIKQDEALWQTFSAPRSDDEFYLAWLTLLCRQLPEVTVGVVLLQSAETGAFIPVAVWPEAGRDLSFLATVAERALVEKRGVVQRSNTTTASVHLAYPIEACQRMLGAVVLEATPRLEAQTQALLRQLHWGVAGLRAFFHQREGVLATEKTERIGSVMDVVAVALRQGRLQQILFDVANHVGRHLQCSRVAIGLLKGDAIRVVALSNAAWFEKNASIVKRYAAAMEEAADQLAPYSYQRPAQPQATSGAASSSAHEDLARESGAQVMLSVPLSWGATCLGVLTLERDTHIPFDAAARTWIDALASLLPAVIEQKRRAERSHVAHLRDDVRALLARLFGPRHLIWKFSAATLLLLVATLALVDIDYRVAAKTVIEGEVQRAIVAPFEGFVAASYVRAGDAVRQGQILCALDDRDLRLEQHKWTSEREQYHRKLREAMAGHDAAAIQVVNAQIQQTEAQLALTSERLSRARIIAPFDGIVISGDLSQLIGSPVEAGKKLFEIAPLQAYRVILQVDEHEVRHIHAGQNGKLAISGIVDAPVPFSVSKVTPVATAQDGRNFFRVEARLQRALPHLRPGMEGVGKISVGERGLWWIMTHSFTDWLRISLWTWLP